MASALAALALGAVACRGAPPAARAYGSTELEQVRDPTIVLSYGENSPEIVDYTTGNPEMWWTLDLSTGVVQSYGATMPPASLPPGTYPPQPYTCIQNVDDGDPSGSYTLEIVDNATNVQTDLHGVVTYDNCPGADGTLAAFVFDTSGGIALETGPFTQLTTVALSVDVLGVAQWVYRDTTSSGPAIGATVLAAPVATPDQEELDTIDLATFDVTTIVPAVPASLAWVTGATPAGSLQSTSLAGSAALVQPVDGHYIYPRAMSIGGSAIVAGPIASGAASELALFELPAGTPLPTSSQVDLVSQSALSGGTLLRPNKTLLTWQFSASPGATSDLIVWDDTDLTLTTCPSLASVYLAGLWSPDQSRVLFAVPVPPGSSDSSSSGGPLDLLTLGAPGATASCQQVVGSGVVNANFSPDGAFLFWLVQPSTGEPELWTAASDGTGAQLIAKGEINNAHFIGDGGARLEMTLGGELDWLDLHDPKGMLQHVAEQVHGPIYDFMGGPWLIMTYEWSTTDGTGTLALINRDNKQVHTISPSVTQYEVLIQEQAPDGGLISPLSDAGVGLEFVVVYVVRGRNPSSQDGIWRATITPSELQ